MENKKIVCEGSFQEAAFDKASNIIRGVVLLGPLSKNNREYTRECMQKAVPLFEGRQAFINHPTAEEERTGRRDVRNLAGRFSGIKYAEGKIRGDLSLLPTPAGEIFRGIAESDPAAAGLSSNAHGLWRSESGKQIVEELTEVFSVDLVANPATTKGLFESDGSRGNGPITTGEAANLLLGHNPNADAAITVGRLTDVEKSSAAAALGLTEGGER